MLKRYVKKHSFSIYKIVGNSELNIDVEGDEVYVQILNDKNVFCCISRSQEQELSRAMENSVLAIPDNLKNPVPWTESSGFVNLVFGPSWGEVNISTRSSMGLFMDEGQNYNKNPRISDNLLVGVKESLIFKMYNHPTPTYESWIIVRSVNYIPKEDVQFNGQ